jgi:hypothetical protein
MTSESKILTVSYGTFSCTLEGFENPFDTMKAIAEYFRDLAAQDRHFGAEPPPPDAAMLHRLAEREVARLAAAGRGVEAPKAEAHADEAVAESPVSPRIQFNPAGRRPARNMAEPEAPVAEDTAGSEPSLQDIIPDGVAAKLARIRRSVHPAAAEAAGTASAFLADAPAEDLAAEPLLDAAPLADAVDAELSDIDLPASEPVESAADVLDVEPVEHTTPDFAARLNEVIAGDPLPTLVDEEPLAEARDVLEDAPWNVSIQDAAFEDVAVAEIDDAPVEVRLDDDAALMSDTAIEDLADLAALDGESFDEAALAAALDDSLPEDAPVEMTLVDAETVDPLPEVIEPAAEIEALVEVAEPVEATEEIAAEDVQPAAGSRRNSSRVVRLRPNDSAAPRDPAATRVLSRQEETDEVARLMQQAEEVMAEDENRRRQEALSRLKAAIVSTEADRADIDYEAPRADVNLDPYRDDLAEAIQPDEPVAPPPPPEVKPRRKSMPVRTPDQPRPGTIRPGMISPAPLVLVSEQRVDRVAPAAASLAPAEPGIGPAHHGDQPMPGMRTGRLSGAIGSGAAVAVQSSPARGIVLEKPSYGPATDADDDEDLAEDVREIDESGLAAFAETVGARSMVEMLEAAAAFATCVEKREQFTRPQLMRRMMASAGGKPVSREDGLRSFGTLLRTGRIEKVTRGHYALADTSPYLAEARRLN